MLNLGLVEKLKIYVKLVLDKHIDLSLRHLNFKSNKKYPIFDVFGKLLNLKNNVLVRA